MGKGKKSESKVISPKDRSQTLSPSQAEKNYSQGARKERGHQNFCKVLVLVRVAKVINKRVDKKNPERETPGLLTRGPQIPE